jgi:hypothetical protein
MNHKKNTVSFVIVQQYLDLSIETNVCLSPYCVAMDVLVVLFEVSSQQRVLAAHYDGLSNRTKLIFSDCGCML